MGSRNSNFSPEAVKRSIMNEIQRDYGEKKKLQGAGGYFVDDKYDMPTRYPKGDYVIERRIGRSAESPRSIKQHGLVQAMLKNLKARSSQMSQSDYNRAEAKILEQFAERELHDKLGVQTVYKKNPETGELERVGTPQYFSFGGIRPSANYVGQWLKAHNIDGDAFDKMTWPEKSGIMQRIKGDLMFGWKERGLERIGDIADPDTLDSIVSGDELYKMPFDYDLMDESYRQSFDNRNRPLNKNDITDPEKEKKKRGRPRKIKGDVFVSEDDDPQAPWIKRGVQPVKADLEFLGEGSGQGVKFVGSEDNSKGRVMFLKEGTDNRGRPKKEYEPGYVKGQESNELDEDFMKQLKALEWIKNNQPEAYAAYLAQNPIAEVGDVDAGLKSGSLKTGSTGEGASLKEIVRHKKSDKEKLEAENKDQEPEADPKMGDHPSDIRTKRVEKMKSNWGKTSTQKKKEEEEKKSGGTVSDSRLKDFKPSSKSWFSSIMGGK